MSGWWRHNRIALVLLVVLIPASVFVLAGLPALDDATYAPAPRVVAVGQHAVVYQRTWSIRASKEFVGTGTGSDGNGIPTGSSLIGVLIEVTPQKGAKHYPQIGDTNNLTEGASCTPTLQKPAAGLDHHQWTKLDDPAEYRYGLLDSTVHECDPVPDTAETMEFVYLVPTGARAGAGIDVFITDGKRPQALLLELTKAK